MKIETRYVGGGRQALGTFADQHGLVMRVTERPKPYGLPRWHASFQDVEIAEGGFLRSTFGDGETPEDAIAVYAREIEGRKLVYCAYRPERREFTAPNDLTVASAIAKQRERL